jgi:hypothetical protein
LDITGTCTSKFGYPLAMADRNKKIVKRAVSYSNQRNLKKVKIMKGAINYLNMHVQRQEPKYVISLVPVDDLLKETMQSKTELSV